MTLHQILESVWQDVKLAPRLLLRSPVLAVTILLTLTLGIGVNSGVFTLIDGVLYRARVLEAPESFARVSTIRYDSLGRADESGLATTAEFTAYQKQSVLQPVTAWTPAHMTVGRTTSVQMLGMLVSCDFFRVYGVAKPLYGRVFNHDECTAPGTEAVVVIGEALWRNQYAADPTLIGKSIVINAVSFTVIGILPNDFAGRTRGPGIWVPFTMQRPFFGNVDLFRQDTTAWLNVEGRIAHGMSSLRVQNELQLVNARVQRDAPPAGPNTRSRPVRVEISGGAMIDEPVVRKVAYWVTPLILASLGLILVLVCSNVTMLLLARAVRRRSEMAVRIALGASRARLFRMMLTESVCLSLVAGLAGIWLAYGVSKAIAHMLLTADSPFFNISLQASTLEYLVGISLVAGIVAGWAPAAESLRQNIADSIRSAGVIGSHSGKRWNVRDSLVFLQVCVSTILIVGAGLFIQTQRTLAASSPGFDADHTIFTRLDAPANGNVAARDATLRDRLSAIPEIKSVAFASSLPVADETETTSRIRKSAAGSPVVDAPYTAVSPDFFRTLGIRIENGRTFSADEHRDEIVLSHTLARKLWPAESSIGRQLILENGTVAEVVGEVADTRGSGVRTDAAQFYVLRNSDTFAGTLLVRFDGDVAKVNSMLRATIREMDPDAMPIGRTIRSLLIERAERFWRLVRLVLVLAGLAIVLSAVGIFGVVSFAVNQETKALSIRLALGASRVSIVRRVMLSSGKPTLIGMGLGLCISSVGGWALERVFASTPIPVQAGSPLVYVVSLGLVALVATTAMAIPVRRALLLNVNELLR